MVPTLEVGDFILVDKMAYGMKMPVVDLQLTEGEKPARGDVMVFIPPHDPRYFIKRVIGIPGDTVRYENKTLTINGERLKYTFVRDFSDFRYGIPAREYIEEIAGVEHRIHRTRRPERSQSWVLVPVNTSCWAIIATTGDSRTWGLASHGNVVGKAVAIWANKKPGWNLPTFHRNRWLEQGSTSRLMSQTTVSTADLERLQRKIGYRFKRLALLKQALTHKSFSKTNNERLEFMGDAVLGYLVGNMLYQHYPDVQEDALSLMRAQLVRGKTLAQVAGQIDLSEHLLLGVGELRSGGRQRASILADAWRR